MRCIVPFVLDAIKSGIAGGDSRSSLLHAYTNLLASSSSMATTPFFIWATQASSSSTAVAAATDRDIGGLGAAEEAAAKEVGQLSPELASAVARPRLRRQSSAPAKQQAGGNKKPPQRGLGVAELERLRCGGDPLRDLNAAVAAAAMGDAANVHGHTVIHHHHMTAPAFDAETGGRHYAPLLVRPAPPPPPPAPFCYVPSSSPSGQNVAPDQQYPRDLRGCVRGFAGAGHPPHLLPLAPEHPSSQSNTIWRPASSSSSCCLHTGHRCDLSSMTMRTMAERGATTTTTTAPDYSIYDLAAAMASARKFRFFTIRRRKDKGSWLGRGRTTTRRRRRR
ncbi:hypothetical protein GUJ93_ZPchr0010g8697 [Zizania palustris]|uniref:Uncharacterized protein n=1 Tax=Zizania palustris TaxID=103762 RepID=A0A8J5WA51_ZIZPA|nr:hypothetical protein GUJ93_ZPchr0010g8697 [Zizania palustris]